MVSVHVHPEAGAANTAAAAMLGSWLAEPGVGSVMLAAGNTPLELYRLLGERGPVWSHLHLFALDEYVGVPLDEPRTCANVIRRSAAEPWGIRPGHYHVLSSLEHDALASVRQHETRLAETGGLDVIVLGLGQNGHLGFNEPGSAEDSVGRLVDLDTLSVEANRRWFGGEYAPDRGVTVGMRTILSARRIMVLAYGSRKAAAVAAMLRGPRDTGCPASLLQGHGDVHVFLDEAAAASAARNL